MPTLRRDANATDLNAVETAAPIFVRAESDGWLVSVDGTTARHSTLRDALDQALAGIIARRGSDKSARLRDPDSLDNYPSDRRRNDGCFCAKLNKSSIERLALSGCHFPLT